MWVGGSPDVLWRGSDEGGSKYECQVLDTHLVLRFEGCHSKKGGGRKWRGGEEYGMKENDVQMYIHTCTSF